MVIFLQMLWEALSERRDTGVNLRDEILNLFSRLQKDVRRLLVACRIGVLLLG